MSFSGLQHDSRLPRVAQGKRLCLVLIRLLPLLVGENCSYLLKDVKDGEFLCLYFRVLIVLCFELPRSFPSSIFCFLFLVFPAIS